MMIALRARLMRLEQSAIVEGVLLVAIVAVAAALRFYKLADWSLWIDEISTIGRVENHYNTLEAALRNIPPDINWIPTSVILTAVLVNAVGVSAWSVRLAPVLIGILTIPALYFGAAKIFDRRVALLSALLLAISPWHLSWSQNARFYTAVLLFFFLSFTVIYLGLERDRPLYLVIGLLFFYLAASERFFALFLVPVITVYVLCVHFLPFEKPPGLKRRNLIILALPVIGGLVVEASSLLSSGSSRFFGDFGWFFLYRNNTPLRLLAAILFSASFVLIGVGICGSFYLLRQKSRAGLLLTILAVLPTLVLLPLSTFMFTQERYVFVTLPAWIILASVAVGAVWARLQAQHMALAVALLLALIADAGEGTLLYYRAYDGNRLNWQDAFALVSVQAAEEDAVVAYWPQFADYYLDREIIAWDDVDIHSIQQMDRRIWFVVDSETVWGDLKKKAWIESHAQLIEVFYLRTPEDQYLRVYLYDPDRVSEEQES